MSIDEFLLNIMISQMQRDQIQLALGSYKCSNKTIKFFHCPPPTGYHYNYIWTRYPLPTTRMWNLLSIFDPPAYTCFFTSLTLTVILMKFYTHLLKKFGSYQTYSEWMILVPTEYFENILYSLRLKYSFSLEISEQVNRKTSFISRGFSIKLLFTWHCFFGGILL